MRVLQFGFSNDDDHHQPHRFDKRCVVYPGTHDNNTTQGRWREKAEQSPAHEADDQTELARVRLYLGAREESIHHDLIRAAMTSVADLAIIPAQDLLGLGAEARMNRPGRSEGNWRWRFSWDQVSPELAGRLRRLVDLYGRL
jgi:4-alpha-glucanotransferase